VTSSDGFHDPPDRAERALLGALMTLASAAECPPTLRADDFGSEQHRRIYRAMLDLEADESSIDLVTVWNALGRREDTYLASLLDAVPDCDAVKDYARIVMDNAARRRRAKWATR